MNNKIIKEISFAGKNLVLETGTLAQQANLAVKLSFGETVVLATAVAGNLDPSKDFFPLSVNYEEKMYASGSIKSSRFVKRDGRPTDEATVTRRLIDHAIRPLFPKDFKNEVQVAITVLSLDPEADPVVAAMLATSAALHASNIPWAGPMTSTKVGMINGEYVLNPTNKQLHEETELDMMVSFVGNDQKFLAIECEANNLAENKILGAIEFARNSVKPVLELFNEFAKEVNPKNEKFEYESQKADETLVKNIKADVEDKLIKLIENFNTKAEYSTERGKLTKELVEKYGKDNEKHVLEAVLFDLEKKIVQKNVLNESRRTDRRSLNELRKISCEVSVLPRTHGSAIFNRGITQSLTTATLGNPSSELLVQDMYGERSKRYLHYYNFPPFSTGEVGRMGGAGGREIGHGMLAEKALRPVIPAQADFPYMIMLNTEILSSDGSTSMAATCGSTLALMDAGVPIKSMVAGISIGLVADEENSKYVLLTDIVGNEDFTGHMDFKIAGTDSGVTAIQLDMKVKGIPMDILPKVFEQSKEARLQILEVMKQTIEQPKTTLSKYAPKMMTIKVQPDQVGMIIGSGGKTIKEIQERTGTELGIEDDGTVFISGISAEGVEEAYRIVEGMTKEVERGEIYEGKVDGITDFGAFIEILPGRTGLLHLSEIAQGYVKNVEEHLQIGDTVRVKVIDTSRDGKISLSMKALLPGAENESDDRSHDRRSDRGGRDDRGGHKGRGDRRDDRSRGRR